MWSGRRDSNPRPQRPERCALTKLRHVPPTSKVPNRPKCQRGQFDRRQTEPAIEPDPKRQWSNQALAAGHSPVVQRFHFAAAPGPTP